MSIEKLYNEKGEVAVAVSIGFGAGWSTWGDVSPLDKEFNELILNGDFETAEKLAKEKGFYAGGLSDCKIVWLEKGTKFRIDEYDGAESIVLLDEKDYNEA